MQPQSSSPRPSPIAGLSPPEPPAFDLPLPVRYLKPVRVAIGEAYKGAYLLGAADGVGIGQTIGYAEGHVAGVLEGSGLTAVMFGITFFVAAVLRGKR